MNDRRHHNNKGYRQIRRGKTARQVEAMARRVFGFKRVSNFWPEMVLPVIPEHEATEVPED